MHSKFRCKTSTGQKEISEHMLIQSNKIAEILKQIDSKKEEIAILNQMVLQKKDAELMKLKATKEKVVIISFFFIELIRNNVSD